jgi:hypothetical protein
LTGAELQQLRDLLDKIVEADPTVAAESGPRVAASKTAGE